jgi:hypothetical protein
MRFLRPSCRGVANHTFNRIDGGVNRVAVVSHTIGVVSNISRVKRHQATIATTTMKGGGSSVGVSSCMEWRRLITAQSRSFFGSSDASSATTTDTDASGVSVEEQWRMWVVRLLLSR